MSTRDPDNRRRVNLRAHSALCGFQENTVWNVPENRRPSLGKEPGQGHCPRKDSQHPCQLTHSTGQGQKGTLGSTAAGGKVCHPGAKCLGQGALTDPEAPPGPSSPSSRTLSARCQPAPQYGDECASLTTSPSHTHPGLKTHPVLVKWPSESRAPRLWPGRVSRHMCARTGIAMHALQDTHKK